MGAAKARNDVAGLAAEQGRKAKTLEARTGLLKSELHLLK